MPHTELRAAHRALISLGLIASLPLAGCGGAADDIELFGVASTLLPTATLGQPYQAELIYRGGTPPVTWTMLGALPEGLQVSADGRIEGTPTRFGDYQLEARAEDSAGNTARTDLTLQV